MIVSVHSISQHNVVKSPGTLNSGSANKNGSKILYGLATKQCRDPIVRISHIQCGRHPWGSSTCKNRFRVNDWPKHSQGFSLSAAVHMKYIRCHLLCLYSKCAHACVCAHLCVFGCKTADQHTLVAIFQMIYCT